MHRPVIPCLLVAAALLASCEGMRPRPSRFGAAPPVAPEVDVVEGRSPAAPEAAPKDAGAPVVDPTPRAREIAEAVLENLGGREAWEATRHVHWRFLGGREHWWDRATDNIRLEYTTKDGASIIVLMNLQTRRGRAFRDGREVRALDELDPLLEEGYKSWVNDSYWMFMPYKLLDPGVHLRYLGKRAMEDGRPADAIEVTFDEVGETPGNLYVVCVAEDTGHVEEWTFYTSAADDEPRFTRPWHGWKRFGEILLATDHGFGWDWDIAVYETMSDWVYTRP